MTSLVLEGGAAPRRSALLRVVALLWLCAVPARADWWGSVGGAVSGALGEAQKAGAVAAETAQHAAEEARVASIAAADSQAAQQLEVNGMSFLEQARNTTGEAIDNAKHMACDMRVGQNIAEVRRTMFNQLDSDCEATASKINLVHDQIFDTCESMGAWNINRTLEAQKAEQTRECLQVLEDASHDLVSTLDAWGQQSKSTLTKEVQPAIQSAIAKAQETVATHSHEQGGLDGADVLLQKFSVSGPETPRAASRSHERMAVPTSVGVEQVLATGIFAQIIVGSAIPLLLAACAVTLRRAPPRARAPLLPMDEPLD